MRSFVREAKDNYRLKNSDRLWALLAAVMLFLLLTALGGCGQTGKQTTVSETPTDASPRTAAAADTAGQGVIQSLDIRQEGEGLRYDKQKFSDIAKAVLAKHAAKKPPASQPASTGIDEVDAELEAEGLLALLPAGTMLFLDHEEHTQNITISGTSGPQKGGAASAEGAGTATGTSTTTANQDQTLKPSSNATAAVGLGGSAPSASGALGTDGGSANQTLDQKLNGMQQQIKAQGELLAELIKSLKPPPASAPSSP